MPPSDCTAFKAREKPAIRHPMSMEDMQTGIENIVVYYHKYFFLDVSRFEEYPSDSDTDCEIIIFMSKLDSFQKVSKTFL